ncbi:hypothetical protein ACFL1B_02640 [Nanoarchaeota archaeon]
MAAAKKVNFFQNYRKRAVPYTITLVVIVLLFVFMATYVMSSLLVILTIALSIIIGLANLKWTGLELVTLTTVLFGMSFGSSSGAIIGLILVVLHLILGRYSPNIYIFWVIPSFVIAGAVAGMFPEASVATVGITIVVILHVVDTLLTALLSAPSLPKYLSYAVFNLIFNIIIFSLVAPKIMLVLV